MVLEFIHGLAFQALQYLEDKNLGDKELHSVPFLNHYKS